MKRTHKIIGLLLVLVLCMSFALVGCQDQPATNAPGTTGSKPAETPTTPSGTTQPAEPGDALAITVIPEALEIYAGDAFELLMGVTVNKADASLFVSDDEGFDAEVPGTYTITYTAQLGEEKTTATRTITVLEALSNLTLEVVKNHMTAGKWEGVFMSFKHSQYVELSDDYTTTEALTGVFKNTSDKDIIVNIGGKNGEAAILNANGMVIEGRDGANGKLVNIDNPIRTSSPGPNTTIIVNGEEVKMADNFAKAMTVPAGGYVIVVQTGAFGEGFDHDGRGFICQSVIHQYGNVIRLFWADTNEELTTYVNQKPIVSGNNKVLAMLGDTSFSLDTAILAGLAASDDNGTFNAVDDIKIENFTIVNNGGFDINVAGEYTITLSVTDGELTTEFTRVVEVKADGVGILKVGNNKFYVDMERVKFNEEVTKIGNIAFLIYTNEFTGNMLANGHGIAFILDEYGVLVRIYDGANAKYYDAEYPEGSKETGKVTSAGYLAEAFASLQDGETMLAAINDGGSNLARGFLGSADSKIIGNKVSGLDMEFKTTDVTITINGAELTVPEGKWLYNTAVGKTTAQNYQMIIFDKNFEGTFETNGYGCAIVLNQYGELTKVYAGAYNQYWTAEGQAATCHFDANTYATVAFSELQEGELLIIFPNDGGSNVGRNWALDLRGLKGTNYFGEVAKLTGFTFQKKEEI